MSTASPTASAPQLERYTCASCSYGVSVVRLPKRCPMCGDQIWKPELRKESHGT